MSLKKEITLILLVVVGLFTALDYTVQRFVIYPSYRNLDRGRARVDLQRSLAALQHDILHLDSLVHDWSAWDESLNFIRDHNSAFIESNLGPNTFRDNRLNAIFILDIHGRVVWGRSCGPGDLSPLSLASLPQDMFPANSPLLEHQRANDSVAGIMLTEAGPMMIAARPIVDSGETLKPFGTIVMGRLLDQEELQGIADQTGIWLTIWSCPDCSGAEAGTFPESCATECKWQGAEVPGPDDLLTLSAIKKENPVVLREQGGGHMTAYVLYPDLVGPGVLVLSSSSGMPISAAGSDVLRGAMLSLLCVGLLILVVLLEALKFSVLKPISLLTRHAEALRRSTSHESQISTVLGSRNEIGVLAREFDSMVAQLTLARRQLAEQSYYSGMTEMASGVIHNLRNALTPVTANLDLLKEEFRDLPLSPMKMAGTELDAAGLSDERRDMLVRYLRESLDYLTELMVDVQIRLKNLDSGVVQVEKILSDQEKFIAVTPGGEAIDPVQLLREAANLLNLDFQSEVELWIDPSLTEAGAVEGQRNGLLHVFTNLISNASDAIFRSGQGKGRIDIKAIPSGPGEKEQVHIMISDNGCGIPLDDLPHLFERGYTTKDNAGSGIGLHWCANTVAAMHGRLWAESAGPGQGATLHLVLRKSRAKFKGVKSV